MTDAIQVTISMTKEVAEYYKQYLRSPAAWSKFVDMMLERYELESLPPTEGEKYTQRTITVTNPYYISLYNQYGAKSKRCSIARLIAFGKDIDIFAEEEFLALKDTPMTASAAARKIAALSHVIKELNVACGISMPSYEKQEAYLKDVRDFIFTYRTMLTEDGNENHE